MSYHILYISIFVYRILCLQNSINNHTPWLNRSQNYHFATFLYKYLDLQSYVLCSLFHSQVKLLFTKENLYLNQLVSKNLNLARANSNFLHESLVLYGQHGIESKPKQIIILRKTSVVGQFGKTKSSNVYFNEVNILSLVSIYTLSNKRRELCKTPTDKKKAEGLTLTGVML